MSPAGYASSIAVDWNMATTGHMYSYTVSNSSSLRPVINLKSAVTVVGSGTSTEPYKVQ